MEQNNIWKHPIRHTIELGYSYNTKIRLEYQEYQDLLLNTYQLAVDHRAQELDNQMKNASGIQPTQVTQPTQVGETTKTNTESNSNKDLSKNDTGLDTTNLTPSQQSLLAESVAVADSIINSHYDYDIEKANKAIAALQKALIDANARENNQKKSGLPNLTNLYASGLGNTNKESSVISLKLREAKAVRDDLVRRKKADLRQLVELMNPKLLSQSFLSGYLNSLKSQKEILDELDVAKKKFGQVVNRYGYRFGDANSNDIAVRFEQAGSKKDHLDRVKGNLELWCAEHNRLPNSIDELPVAWRDDVRDLLKDDVDNFGNPRLFSQEFKRKYVEALVIEKDRLRLLGQYIFDAIQENKDLQFTKKFIDDYKETARLNEALYKNKNLKHQSKAILNITKNGDALVSVDDIIEGLLSPGKRNPDGSFNKIDNPEYVKKAGNYNLVLAKMNDIQRRMIVSKALSNIEHYTGTDKDGVFGKYGLGMFAEIPAKVVVSLASFGYDLLHGAAGIRELALNTAAKDPINKFNSTISEEHPFGDMSKLTDDEQAVVLSYALENSYNGFYNKEDSDLMRWLSVANQSLEFVAEFMATRGVSTTMKAATKGSMKAASKVLSKKAEELVAKNGVLKLAGKLLNVTAKAGNSKAGEILASLVADAGYAATMVNTVGLPRTLSNAVQYETATPYGVFTSPNTYEVIGSVDPETEHGLWLAERRQFVEYFSEMLGEYGIGKALGKAGKGIAAYGTKGLNKIPKVGDFIKRLEGRAATGAVNTAEKEAERAIQQLIESPSLWKTSGKGALGKVKNLINNYKNGAFRQMLKNNGQWHGFLGEVSEEYYGIMLNHLFGSEEYNSGNNVPYMTSLLWWKDLAKDAWDQSYDIWGGIAVSTGYMSAMSNVGSYRAMSLYRKASEALEKVLGKKVAERFRKSLLFAKYDDMFSIINGYLTNMNVDAKDAKNTMQAVFDYYGRLMYLRGSIIGEDYIRQKMSDIGAEYIRQAKELGYNIGAYVNIENTRKSIDLIKAQLNEVYGFEEGVLKDEEVVLSLIDNYLEEGDADLVNRLYALQYLNNVVIGQQQQISDDIFDKARYIANRAARTINNTTGDIHALMRDKEDEDSPQKLLFYKGGAPLSIMPATNLIITNGTDAEQLVVVSNIDGLMKAMPIKDLNGYYQVNVSGRRKVYDSYIQARNELAEAQDEYLRSVGTRVGDSFTLSNGDKITVLQALAYRMPNSENGLISFENGDFSPSSGVTYMVEHEDGTTEIKYIDDVDEFKEKLEESNNKEAQDITEVVLQKANEYRLKRQAQLYDRFRNSTNKSTEEETNQQEGDLQEFEQEEELSPEELIDYYTANNPPEDTSTQDKTHEDKSDEKLNPDGQNPKEEHSEKNPLTDQNLEKDPVQPVIEGHQFSGTIGDFINKNLSAEDREQMNNAINDIHAIFRSSLSVGVNPELIIKSAIVGKLLIKAGINAFCDHLLYFLENLPKEDHVLLRENIKSIYSYLRYQSDVDASKLTPDSEVSTFDVDNFRRDLSEEVVVENEYSDELLKWDTEKETKAQSDTYRELQALIHTQSQRKIGVSSYHYFLEGKSYGSVEMHSRVHNEIGSRKEDKLAKEFTETYKKFLMSRLSALMHSSAFRSASTGSKIDQLEHFIKNDFLYGNKDNKLQLENGATEKSPIARFGDKFETTFIGRFTAIDPITQEKTEGGALRLYFEVMLNDSSTFEEICEAIAACAAEKDISQSVMSGNLFDDLCRQCMPFDFDGNVSYENTTLKSSDKEFKLSDTVEINNEQVPIMEQEMFNDCIKQLIRCRNEYVRLGWKVITDPLLLSGDFTVTTLSGTKQIKVAGETDAIAIDRNGDLHFIDFKTYKWSRGGKIYEDLETEEFNNFTKQIVLKKYRNTFFDTNSPRESNFVKSAGVHYALQQAMYKLMASVLYKCPKSCELMMMGLHHRYSASALSFYEKPSKVEIDDNWTEVEKEGYLTNMRLHDLDVSQRIAIYKTFDDGTKGFGANRIRIDIDTENLDEATKQAIRLIEQTYVHFSDEKQKQYGNNIQKARIIISSEFLPAINGVLQSQIESINRQCDELLQRLTTLQSATNEAILNFINDVNALRENSNIVQKDVDNAKLQFIEEQERLDNVKSQLNSLFLQYDMKLMWKYLDEVRYDLLDLYIDLLYYSADELQSLTQSNPIVQQLLDFIAEGQSLINWYTNNGGDLNKITLQTTQFVQLVKDVGEKILDPVGIPYAELLQDDVVLSDFGIDAESILNEEDLEDSFLQFGLIETSTIAHPLGMNSSVLDSNNEITLSKAASDKDFTSKHRFFIQQLNKDQFVMVVMTNDLKHQFSPVEINIPHKVKVTLKDDGTKKYTQLGLTKEGEELLKSLHSLFNSSSAPRVEIKGDSIIRTNGRLYHPTSANVVDKYITRENEFSSNQEYVCMTSRTNVGGIRTIVASVPESSGNKNHIYKYNMRNKNTNPSSGTVVFMHKEDWLKDYTPINLMQPTFDQCDGALDLIYNVLSGNNSMLPEGSVVSAYLGSPFTINIRGTQIETPLSNLDVLELIINVQSANDVQKEQYIRLYIDNQELIHIIGRILGADNLVDQICESPAQVIDFLKQNRVKVRVNKEVLTGRFDFNNTALPTKELFDFMEQNDIDKIPLAGNLYFDKSDFIAENGICESGVHWYAKHGCLTCQDFAFKDPLIGINHNFEIGTNYEAPNESSPKKPSRKFRGASLALTISVDGWKPEKVDKEKVEKEIVQMLGETVGKKWFLATVDVLNNEVTLGRCYAYFLEIAENGASGVHYHEIFHRVVELLLTDKEREIAYKEFREMYAKTHTNEKLTDRLVAEKLADQFMYFMQNNVKIFSWKWGLMKSLRNLVLWYKFFNKIGSYRLYRLNRAVRNGKFANQNPTKEQVERFEKFAEAPYLPFEKKGVKINSIVDQHQFNILKKSLMALILSPQTQQIDFTGKHVEHISAARQIICRSTELEDWMSNPFIEPKSKQILIESIGLKTDELGVPVQREAFNTIEVKNEDGTTTTTRELIFQLDAAGNLVYDEEGNKIPKYEYIIEADNHNWIKIQPLLEAEYKKFMLSTFETWDQYEKHVEQQEGNAAEETEDDVLRPADSDETGGHDEKDPTKLTVNDAIRSHIDSADMFAPIDRASQLVKFFFSAIPDVYSKVIEYKSQEGSSSEIIPVPRLNELGLPQLLDTRVAWGRALTKLHDVEDYTELYERVCELAKSDYTFRIIKNRLDKLVNAAFTINDDGTWTSKRKKIYVEKETYEDGEKVVKKVEAFGESTYADEAESIYTLIFCAIKGVLIPKRIAKAYNKADAKDDLKKGATIIEDADFSWQTENIRQKWSSNIANGATKYIKLNKEGSPVYSGKASVFESIANALTNLGEWLNGERVNLNIKYDKAVYNEDTGKAEILHDQYLRNADIHDETHIHIVKEWFIKQLNDLGIQVSIEDLDYALRKIDIVVDGVTTKNTGLLAFREFYKRAKIIDGTTKPFVSHVKDLSQSLQGLSTKWSNRKGGQHLHLVDVLSRAQYQREQEDGDMSVLTIAGKKLYMFTENNFITSRLAELQSTKHRQMLNQLSNDAYFLKAIEKAGQTVYEGSVVLNALQNAETSAKLLYISMCGFKSDMDGSSGIEYTSQGLIEDIAMKYAMLGRGWLIFPPLSDKTTYGAIQGFEKLNANLIRCYGLKYYGLFGSKKREVEDVMSIQKWYKEINKTTDGLGLYRHDTYADDTLHVRFSTDTLDQFIAYAKREYESAKIQLEYYQTLTDEDKVEYMHRHDKKKQLVKDKNGELHDPILAARLGLFNGCYYKGKYISFNKTILSREDLVNSGLNEQNDKDLIDSLEGTYSDEAFNLRLAAKYFFDKMDGETDAQLLARQRNSIERLLSNQVEAELEELVRCGALSRMDQNDQSVDRFNFDTSENKFKLDSRLAELINQLMTGQLSGITNDAIVGLVADMTIKYQISFHEISRLYFGNIACYGHEWDSLGYLKTQTVDLFKRLGGLASTGTDNAIGVGGIATNYIVTEVEDDYVSSPELQKLLLEGGTQQNIDSACCKAIFEAEGNDLKFDDVVWSYISSETKQFEYDGETGKLDDATVQRILAIKDRVEAMDDDTKKKLLGEDYYNEIVRQCEEKAGAFEGINVNDGATYISEDMCENLLRQLGLFTGAIKEAFMYLKNLRLEDGKPIDPTVLTKVAKYYSKIYTTVIGMQKYTAYGQRAYEFTDSEGIKRTINVTYYDKTAFAPLFDCICTGGLRLVYEKMKQGSPNAARNISIDEVTGKPMDTVNKPIDMLKIHSATKNGSEGPVKDLGKSRFEKWSNVNDDAAAEDYKNFRFTHIYTQRYRDVRRQFNTDPKEHEDMSFGTQALKVILSVLSPEQRFNFKGTQLTATEMRNGFMSAVKELTELGKESFDKKFFNEDGSLNTKKFGDTLTKNLAARDANDEFIEAMSVDEKTGEQVAPLAAMSGTQWVQSILVSLINSDIVEVVTPGSAFYQRSIWGVEGNSNRFFSNGNNLDYTLYAGNKFSAYNEDGSMDCVLSIDYFEHLFKGTDLEFASFEDKKAFLVKSGIISGWVEADDEHPATHYIEQTIVKRQKLNDKGEPVLKDGKPIMVDILQNPLIGKVKTIDAEPTSGAKITKVRWNNATANIVGYRIPTQATSSIHAMRCVDVLAVSRDTIILPAEITSITGADFDIDKFFLSMKNYRLPKKLTNEELKAAGLTHHEYNKSRRFLEISEDFESDNRKRVLQNKMLDYLLTILKSKDVAMAQLLGSIDKDTRPLTDLAKQINKSSSRLHSYDASSFRVSEAAKLDFAIGKGGIAPFALNNNNHVLCMLYNVTFDMNTEGTILDILNLKRLDLPLDRHGHSIASWISGLINAHVDCAKDPYIRTLGVNPYTYNLVNLLIRTGYGEETFYFTTLPIMRRFYDVHDLAMGVYAQDETRSPQSRAAEDINKSFIKYLATNLHDLFNEGIESNEYKLDLNENSVVSNEQIRKSLYKYYEEQYGKDAYDKIVRSLFYNSYGVEILKKIGIHDTHRNTWELPLIVNNEPTTIDISEAEILTLVALTNFDLQEYGKSLANLVHYTKIDTKKYGKTVEQQRHYMNMYRSLTNPDTSPFDVHAVKRMCELSFIHGKTIAATDALSRLLKEQLLQATPAFMEAIDRTDKSNPGIRARLNLAYDSVNSDVAINKMLSTWIKSQYFFGPHGYCAQRNLTPKSLLKGIKSIVSRLNLIETGIANRDDHYYDHLRAADGKPNNYLLRILIQQAHDEKLQQSKLYATDEEDSVAWEDTWGDAEFIRNNDILSNNVKSDEIQDGWAMLLNDTEHPDILQFADDLVVYAFMTSGDNGGMLDLFKYVPLEWRLGNTKSFSMFDEEGLPIAKRVTTSYVDFMKHLLLLMNDSSYRLHLSEFDIDEMVSTMHWDNNIVPTLRLDKFNKDVMWFGRDENMRTPLLIGAVNGFASEGESPGYFKIAERNYSLNRGQLAWHVYKKVAIGRVNVGNTVKTYPIYGLIETRGGKYAQGQKIYDMGIYRNLSSDNYSFGKLWGYLFRRAVKATPVLNPGQLLQELVYGKLTNDESKINSILALADDTNYNYYNNNQLYQLIQDVAKYENDVDEIHANLKDARTEANVRTAYILEIIDNATQLHLENVENSKYKPITFEELNSMFGQNNPFASMSKDGKLSSKLHYEFYMKSSEDRSFKFPVMTISFIGEKDKGFFELGADVDINSVGSGTSDIKFLGSYLIHFKTQSAKHYDTESKYATVPMTKEDKLVLYNNIISLIPVGKTLSTYGTLSPGGIYAIEHLPQYGNDRIGYLQTRDERTVKDKEGNDIKIPVYTKVIKKPVDSHIPEPDKLEKYKKDIRELREIIDNLERANWSSDRRQFDQNSESMRTNINELQSRLDSNDFSMRETIQLEELKREAERYKDLCNFLPY